MPREHIAPGGSLIRRGTRVRLFIVAISLVALLVEPISRSYLGVAIASFAALLAPFDGLTWMLYITGSQVVGDPQDLPITLAQLGFFAWVITLPANGSFSLARYWPKYLIYVGPFTVWFTCAFLITRHRIPTDILTSVTVGVITYGYVCHPGTNRLLALLMIVLGTGYAAIGYWGRTAGLPMTGEVYEISGAEGSVVQRIGSGRADSTVAGLNIPVFLIGLLATSLFAPAFKLTQSARRRLAAAAFAAVVIGGAALMGTVSRGGLYTVLLCLPVLLILYSRISGRLRSELHVIAMCLFCAVAATWTVPAVTETVSRFMSNVGHRNDQDQTSRGGPSLVSGRVLMWATHLKMMAAYPIAGIYRGEIWDFTAEYGVGRVGYDNVWGCAHNVFLDYGSSGGVPAFIMFVILFFRAPILLTSRIGLARAAPFLAVGGTIFFGFMSLSVGTWKTFWEFLALVLCVAHYGVIPVGRSGYETCDLDEHAVALSR